MIAGALLGAVLAGPAPPVPPAEEVAKPDAPSRALQHPGDAAIRASIGKGLEFLLAAQHEDGSWGGYRNATFVSGFANAGTYHSWQVATTALACRTLLELGAGDASDAALQRGLDYLCRNAELRRPAEWDIDNVWGLIYGTGTLARVLADARFQDEAQAAPLRAAASTMLAGMAKYQSPRGGWGYYADPDGAWRPEWATSFTTAVGLLALVDARAAGLEVDQKVFAAAVRAVETARLPSGAYQYDVDPLPNHLYSESINQVKGSLGRIQVCNLALHRAGATLPPQALERGLEMFFRHHHFLDAARNKPIPHESWYANAAYFHLFGHYYAAQVLEELPAEARAAQKARLAREILKCQQADGAFWDFWVADCTKPYGTSFAVMTLGRTILGEDG